MLQPDAEPSDEEGERPDRRVVLGRITGVHGISGWIKIHSDTAPRENILAFDHWQLQHRGKWSHVVVTASRPQGKTLVAHIDGVDTPEEGRALIGATIAVWRDELPPAEDGEFYWTDLVGMRVVTVAGGALGRVGRMFETGANDVLVVLDERDGVASGREVLVPWVVPDVIVRVDTEERLITIDWDPDF